MEKVCTFPNFDKMLSWAGHKKMTIKVGKAGHLILERGKDPVFEGDLEDLFKLIGKCTPFPIPSSDGWFLHLNDKVPVAIRSSFYDLLPAKPYGAFKATGHLVEIDEQKGSGIVEFGFEDGAFGVINRRRCQKGETLEGGRSIIAIANAAAPDRVDEPVFATVLVEDKDEISKLSAEEWNAIYENSDYDGVVLVCAREVKKWALSE